MTDTFWGLTATGWTAITTLLTGGLLVVAVAGVHAAAGSGRSILVAVVR
jgi:hypothetical protein